MIRSLTLAAGLAVAAGSANANVIGGVLYSDSAWNAAATAAIGQNATVFRLFAVHDTAVSTIVSAVDGKFQSMSGTFYQEPAPFGANTAAGINDGFFAFSPTLEWDTYVSVGRRSGGATTLDPNFQDEDDNVIGWLPNGITNNAGWFNSNPPNMEGQGRVPGATTAGASGAQLPTIPGNFDANYWYTFMGQFTVIGLDTGGRNIDSFNFTPGIVETDFFEGVLTFAWGNPGDTDPSFTTVQFIPTPGAAALFGLAGLAGLRRRR